MTSKPITDTGEDDSTAVTTPVPASMADEYRSRAAVAVDYAREALRRASHAEAAAWADLARTEIAVSDSYLRAQIERERKREARDAF